jgi:pimeloyl-ACP methyl ester carboxylesterase
VTQVVKAADGRRLAVESSGRPDGAPVFLLHGTPGGRNGPQPRGIVLYRLGIRLISYDRPGYGGSDPLTDRTVVDTAADVATIADELAIERFGVVGRSGGAPHALACAAVMTKRVYSAAALASLAPPDAAGLDWWDGMADSNVEAYRDAQDDKDSMVAELAARARRVRSDPESLLGSLRPELVSHDLKVVGDTALRRIIAETYAEALQESAWGWIDDVLALRRSWGFDLSDIKVPVMLWHGGDDVFSPASHTRWLAEQIEDSTLEVQSGAAHFSAVEVLPRILAWIVNSARAERRQAEPTGTGRQAELTPATWKLAEGRGFRTAAGR